MVWSAFQGQRQWAPALPAMNVNYHSTAIDIAHYQMSRFRAPCPSAVECHQKDAIEEDRGAPDFGGDASGSSLRTAS